MAEWLTVQGTMSGAGKSLVTSLLLDILSEEHSAAPFKPLNFSRNSFPVDGTEIGYSTRHQASKAGMPPEKVMAPVLIKPMEDKTEFIAKDGVREASYGELDRRVGENYFFIESCIEELDERFEYVLWEGFGSMVNSNLDNNPNIDFLDRTGAEIILVGDIFPGGIEAQLKGVHELLPEKFGEKILANVMNKASRRPRDTERTGKFVEEETGVRTFSLPFIEKLGIPEEDGKPGFEGDGEISVVDYPHASNTSDLGLLPEQETGLAEHPSDLDDSRLIILPGSKNTLKDLKWMKERGLDKKIRDRSSEAVVFGVCGGFQILGKKVSGNKVERGEEEGLGLLDMETDFSGEKTLEQVEYSFRGESSSGYRISYGESEIGEENLFVIEGGKEGFFEDDVGGTYIHDSLRNRKFLNWLLEEAGIEAEIEPSDASELKSILQEEVSLP